SARHHSIGGPMLKKLLIALGVIFACLVVSFSLLGLKAISDAPRNKAIAELITRDMARSWTAEDLRPHFVGVAAERVNFAEAQMEFNKMKPLGRLKRVERSQQIAFRAYLGEGSTATIAMVAEFENGRANVTMNLRSERGQMKLW